MAESRGDEPFETGDVEQIVGDEQLVAGWLGLDARSRAVDFDDLADAGDVAPQRRARTQRRLALEHDVGQSIGGHDGVAVDQQQREQAALPATADRYVRTVGGDRKRPQRLELDHRSPPLGRPYSARSTLS